MNARLVLRLALLLVLSMCTDLIAIATLTPIIVIGGPSVGDTLFSTMPALTIICSAPLIAAILPIRWATAVTSLSTLTRTGLCAVTAYALTQPNFSAEAILLIIAAFWGLRVLANESIARVAGAVCDEVELRQLCLVNAVAPAIAAFAWLIWLRLPLNLLPPASILISCACSYSAIAIVFFYWKELWTGSSSTTSHDVIYSGPLASSDSRTKFGGIEWNIPLIFLQTAATLMLSIQFSLALSENYVPPSHPTLHRDLFVVTMAWISAAGGLLLSGRGKLKFWSKMEPRFLLLFAAFGLAPLVFYCAKSVSPLFIGISAATSCLISIVCDRIRLSTNNRWLNACIKSFTIATTYAVAIYMLFQQPIAATFNQWRTLALVSEIILLCSFVLWSPARAALVALASYMVQRLDSNTEVRQSATSTVYLTDSMNLARAAMAAAQLQGILVVITNDKFWNWQPISIGLRYFGVRIANSERSEFLFQIRDQIDEAVVYWVGTTGGFFEQNAKLIDVCFPTVSISRLTLSKSSRFWQPWLKTVAISKIACDLQVIPVTKTASGRR